MKIAVIIPGLIRTFNNNNVIKSFNRTFEDYDIDVYSSIWDIRGKYTQNKKYKSTINYLSEEKVTDSDIDVLKKSYKIKEIKVDSFKEWSDENENFLKEYNHKHPNSGYQMTKNGIFSQYYQILESFKMIPNLDLYDVIVKTRYDITFNKIEFDKINLEENTYYTLEVTNDINVPTDYVFFGTPSFMKKFMGIYEYMKNVDEFNPNNFHKTHPVYTPEIFTLKFLQDNNYNFKNLKLNPKRIR
jgi:hypothetical protein